MKALATFAIVAVALGAGAVSSAEDLYPPIWRTSPPGQDATTHQVWEFSQGPAGPHPNPVIVAPDVDNNQFGDAQAAVYGEFPYALWKATDNGHQGVWRFEDYIQLDVPNSPTPNEYKDIWLQITYSAGYGHTPLILTQPFYSAIETVNVVQLDQYYWHVTYHVRIEPNPDFESIYIQPRDCSVYVDEIVLDTICAPEPGSVLLLSLAALLLRRR